jgi:peptidoglycan/xylan/chitin deacetylase (PgdA/CDA1 family)
MLVILVNLSIMPISISLAQVEVDLGKAEVRLPQTEVEYIDADQAEVQNVNASQTEAVDAGQAEVQNVNASQAEAVDAGQAEVQNVNASQTEAVDANQTSTDKEGDISCNCVIFRLDDIQDYSFQDAQLEILDLFMSKGQKITLAVIMNPIGHDNKIMEKVREGKEKGLFELTVHGWEHVPYSTLSYEEQKNSLQMANAKMEKLFGNKSDIFVAPLGEFNNNTVESTRELGYRVLSSLVVNELKYDQGKSIFNERTFDDKAKPELYRVPSHVDFKEFVNNEWKKIPNKKLLEDIGNDIKQYGYSIITFHPQELLPTDSNGNFLNTPDATDMRDLSNLIDSLLLKNITITSYSELLGLK